MLLLRMFSLHEPQEYAHIQRSIESHRRPDLANYQYLANEWPHRAFAGHLES